MPAKTDFTFKVVKVSDIQISKRITVQIDPAEQVALLAAARKIDPHRGYHEDQTAAASPLTPPTLSGAQYD